MSIRVTACVKIRVAATKMYVDKTSPAWPVLLV